MHTAGNFNRKLYLDQIDEARALGGQKPARARRTIEALGLRYIAQCERLMRQFQRAITRATREDETWIPDAEFVKGFEAIGSAFDRAWRDIRAAKAEENKALKDLSEGEFDQVLAANLVRIARSMPDEHRKAILAQWFGGDAAERLIGIAKPAEVE